MSWLRTGAGVAALVLSQSLAAAETPPSNMLTISGFVPQFANTPAKLAHLRAMPAERLVTRTRNGRMVYLYADPNNCVCVYVGSPEAWRTYQNGGPPGYVGDTDNKSLPRFNTNQIIEEMSADPYVNGPGEPTFDDYVFGTPP